MFVAALEEEEEGMCAGERRRRRGFVGAGPSSRRRRSSATDRSLILGSIERDDRGDGRDGGGRLRAVAGWRIAIVFVFGACRALRAYDLNSDARAPLRGVSSRVHAENIVDSVFCVAARQRLRALRQLRTRFHARVASRPVVEDSRDLAFAHVATALEDARTRRRIDELLRKHGLDVENGLWREVDDFLWLRASQSPHWRELEEDARAPRATVPFARERATVERRL